MESQMLEMQWMDYQTAFNIVLGGFSFLAGVLITNIWKEIKQLQANERENIKRIQQIEILVAGNYTTKEEFTRVMDKVFAKLDDIHQEMNKKADK
jgi:hypothetical protein